MKKLTLYKLLLFVIVAAFFCGCKKFVEVSPPVSQIVTSDVFNNPSSATAAQVAIYTQMATNQECYNASLYNGLLADEFKSYLTDNFSQELFLDNPNSKDVTNPSWINGFNYIYEANAIISALKNNASISNKVANQLTGESEFTRAFWYFYLVNEFGNVPLITTTLYTKNTTIANTPKAQVYQQMIADLVNAENLLSYNYVDASDTTVTTDRVRPNQSTAAALLARVYLYTGNYTDAIKEATKVITNPLYKLVTPLTQTNYVFNISENSEAIWQLYTPLPSSFNGATPDGYNYIFNTQPTNVSLSPQLMSAFEPNDQRKVIWVDSIVTGGVTYYYPNKYQVGQFNSTGVVTEYEMVLRLAEQYLIRAEAEAELGSGFVPAAIADLNVIRNRAGLPNYSGLTDQASVLTAILHERQVELFTEWGHRWFDLIRALDNKNPVNVNTVMGVPGNVCHDKGGTWNLDDHQLVYPIPLYDITSDPNLKQNPGY